MLNNSTATKIRTQVIVTMDKTRKHLISLAVFTAISAAIPVSAFAQLHLEIAKAPEQAPKIAIIPFYK